MDRFIPSRSSTTVGNGLLSPPLSSALLLSSPLSAPQQSANQQSNTTTTTLISSTATAMDAWVSAAASGAQVRRTSPSTAPSSAVGVWLRGGSNTETRIHNTLLAEELTYVESGGTLSASLDESFSTADTGDTSLTADTTASAMLAGLSLPLPVSQAAFASAPADTQSATDRLRGAAAQDSWRSPQHGRTALLLARDEQGAVDAAADMTHTIFGYDENAHTERRATAPATPQRRRVLQFRSPLVAGTAEDDDAAAYAVTSPGMSSPPRTPSRSVRARSNVGTVTPSRTARSSSFFGSPSASEPYDDDNALRLAGIQNDAVVRTYRESPGRTGYSSASYSSLDDGILGRPPQAGTNFMLPSPARSATDAIRAQSLGALSPGTTAVLQAPRHQRRKVVKVPYKVLDAPGLPDDFYLNILDWSSHNVLAVGLLSDVYLWEGTSCRVEKLASYSDGVVVASVGWSHKGNHLAIGLSTGDVQIWDVQAKKLVRTMHGHTQRATAAVWAGPSLATCGRDATIYVRDVRAAPDFHTTLKGHKHEVCGLRWSPDWSMLASGANDNTLMIWSANYAKTNPATNATAPLWTFAVHKAAVKAIAWSPHQAGLIASGGGSHDRTIRFHKVTTGEACGLIDVGAQVTQLAWAPHANELASTQGFSQNSLCLWRYPSLTKFATLSGHQSRVLYMALAPDGQSIATGAADETLRFWHAFPGPSSSGESEYSPASMLLPVNEGSTLSPLTSIR